MLWAPHLEPLEPRRTDVETTPLPADRWRRALLYSLPAWAAIAALAVSWQCWINPFIDSGREMDVPWRLLQGERLYRDITYYYGPLGPWTNALALRLFGARWLSLELVCGALSALILLLLFRLTRRAGGLLAASVGTALAAALCIGAPRGGAFIFPYSSSSLFALAGGLAALEGATAGQPRRRRLLWVSLGLAVALASRLEIGLAAAAALAIAGLRAPAAKDRRDDLAAVACGGLAAAGVYGIALLGIPWRGRLADGPFGPILHMPAEWRFLYLKTAGLAQPGATAGRLAVSLVLDGLLLAAAAWLVLPRSGDGRGRRHLFVLLGLPLLAAYAATPWFLAADNLPPLLFALPPLAALAALALLRRPLAARDRAQFLLFSFSAVVASRVFLGLAVGPHMGPHTAVPLPGLLASGAVLCFDRLAPLAPAPAVFRRRLAAMLVLFGSLFLVRLAQLDHQPQIVRLTTAAGTLRLPANQAAAIARTLLYLKLYARGNDTLAAFPESGFFNFVTGLRSPLRQDLILPGVLSGPREAAAAELIDTAGPRYILLCNRPTAEYGPAAFGRDYAVPLWSAVEHHYALTEAFGAARPTAPVGAKDFFIRLYERTEPQQLASSEPRHGEAQAAMVTVEMVRAE